MSNKKLLLVEDEVLIAMSTEQLLRKYGFDVVLAHNGEKAIDRVCEDPNIDLILMDIDLGTGIDGTQAAIRILEKHPLPIVFLTSHSEKEMVDKVKGITRYGYVLKTASEFVLIETITTAFELFSAHQNLLLEKEHVVQNEAELASIYEHAPVLLLLLDKERKIHKANAFAAGFSGTTAETLIGKRGGDALKCLNSLDDPRGCGFGPACQSCDLKQVVIDTFKNGESYYKVKVTLPFSSGEEKKDSTFLVSTACLRQTEESFVLVAIEDITDLITIEKRLRSKQDHFQYIYDYIPVMLHSIDHEGTLVNVSENWLNNLGYDREEVLGHKSVDFLTASSRNYAEQDVLPAFYKDKCVMDIPYQFVKKNGELVDVLLSAISENDENGQFVRSIAILKDVTQENQIKKELEQKAHQLREVTDSIPGMVYQFVQHPDGTFSVPYVNNRIVEYSGYTAEEVMQNPSLFFQPIHPDDLDDIQKKIKESAASLTQFKVIHRLIDRDGAIRWFKVKSTPRRCENGDILWNGVSLDITTLKQDEELLQNKHVFLWDVFDALDFPLYVIDVRTHEITLLNKAAERRGRVENGSRCYEYIHQNTVPCSQEIDGFTCPIRQVLKSGKPMTTQHFHATNGDTPKPVQLYAYPLFDPKGELSQIIECDFDVSEQIDPYQQIKKSLSEKDILIKEIHHRVKNHMGVIASLLKLQADHTDDGRVQQALRESQNRVETLSAIHKLLLASEDQSGIDLKLYISNICDMLIRTYSVYNPNIKLTTTFDNVRLKMKQIHPFGLVVNELLTNCLKYAFPDNREGEITIAIRRLQEDVELAVSDNGVGMPEGLEWGTADTFGLNLIKLIVENQLDGTIDVNTQNGTTVKIRFNPTLDES